MASVVAALAPRGGGVIKVVVREDDTVGTRGARGRARARTGAIVRCGMATGDRAAATSTSTANRTSIAAQVVGAVLKFPPLWEAASKNAKEKMIKRAAELGVDWENEVSDLRRAKDWDAALRDAMNPAVDASTPEYYKTSFHAYPEGNLGWDPAHEVEVAAKAVHAPVFSADGKTLDKDGDANLRDGYHAAQAAAIDAIAPGGAAALKKVVDVGCSSGLSTRALVGAFPAADTFVGVDLSPHFIAVARHGLSDRPDEPAGYTPDKVRFEHGAGESLPFEDGSQDLVSACLVFHELPATAAADVIAEAYRVLKPGGFFTMMDMDPSAPAFQRIANNVFAFTAFKSTEPYLEQYAALNVQEVARRAGFGEVDTRSNSPRHRTITARKPLAA